ncbi:TonB-dependent receptor [Bacteroides faecichinchillae]|uniref:TonB-linked outer membrane protein, SusC/RagA family n=1 Tax=Bacteroides faecichinchillae TaxID=871325 RepID=A0A1M5E1V2_9BACE|nr:TonB-dependent receptor [Bacteroides faecichinchillae]SHF73156.1 TonB-linked outer membrane protein, SusC/RagA family [Bacteroides faecichinchillae]
MQERHILHGRRMPWISWLQSMSAFPKKSILMVVVLLLASIVTTNTYGQNASTTKSITVQGQVMDAEGVPIPGVNIRLKGQNTGTISDMNGNYKLSDVTEDAVIEFSFIGFATLEKKVKGETLNAILLEDTKSLDEVEIVAFGTQKKESVIGSISTLKPAELKVPTSNLTNALAGRVAGVIAYQRTGEPGVDDSNFFIRGVTSFGYAKSPLILIDNIEVDTKDLSRLQPDDIESFSIMKDATATALYGSRGANGVILVKTKEGQTGTMKLNLRVENSISTPTKMLELADPITYMKLHNEAILTRDPLHALMYSEDKIDNTVPGHSSVIYPVTDWRNELLKDYTMNQRVNLNISGGGSMVNYYVAGSFMQDNGILNVDKANNFNNNIKNRNYSVRSNINIKLSKTTKLMVRMNGAFEDYNGPLSGGSDLYYKIMQSNPVLFPATYPKDEEHAYVKHIMFGNSGDGKYINPYAEMVKGYKETGRAKLESQFELNQDLDFITKGLKVRALFNTSRLSYYSTSRQYKPFYYALGEYNYMNNTYAVDIINPNDGTEYLDYNEGDKTITANTYLEAAVNYDREFGKHGVGGLLVMQLRNNHQPNASSLQTSLPKRNVGLSGRFTYAYDSRYFVEGNFGYNGSERFDKDHRWGFFPSAGLAYMVSNEKYFKNLLPYVQKLKLRASYGLVGNDNIGDSNARFLYLSEINMNNGGTGASFGYNEGAYKKNGIGINRYADPSIGWEVAKKMNFAVEMTFLDALNVTAEYYKESRDHILQSRADIPNTMGLWKTPNANLGKAKSHGVDLSLDYNKYFTNDTWLQLRGNFTYAANQYVEYEEVEYPGAPWKSRVGNPIAQEYGYIAEGLFVDDEEVRNSPVQFGEYGAGDIKYRDVNRDGVISELDMVPIGYSKDPEIVYGFGASYGFKNFDVSVFFQGLARESFWIDYGRVSPFFDNSGTDARENNQLAKFIADNHWSETNRNIYAVWPRLSDSSIENNAKKSTWFMRDGSFLRLKQLEIGYTLPQRLIQKAGLKNLRVYFTGNNLFCFSKFKEWDVEQAGDGLKYPLQRIYNIGLNLTF